MSTPDASADDIREEEDWHVHALRELLREGDRLGAALAESEDRVERLRAYSEELVWGFTATEQKALEHLHPGDLVDKTEEMT